MIKNLKLFFITVSLLLLLSIIFLFIIYPMKLDKKIEITDFATLSAIVLTLVAAVFAFYFKNQQTELLKSQRQKDLLEIAQANENSELARKESEEAKRDAATAFENAASSNESAAKAELKSRELEVELLKLRLAVSVQKKTITTFDVAVSIEFSGKWDKPPYSLWLQPPHPITLLTWTDNSHKNPDLEFSTSKISYETINSSTGLFKNTLIIQPGHFPLGQLTDILKAYDEMAFWIVLSWPENLLNPKITFNKVDIVFSINGSKRGELHYQPNVSMDYSEALKALVPGKASWLEPRMELNGKPVDVLKMSLE